MKPESANRSPVSPARIIAIGDIHGCSLALAALIDAIEPTPRDMIVTLGDYIDRGPDSRGVIDQLIALQDRCQLVPLLGNHEIMFLQVLDLAGMMSVDLQMWLSCGGEQTLNSYGGDIGQIPEEHIAFLKQCRRYHETAEHIFLHANYAAELPLNEQPDYLVFWEHITRHIPARHQSGKTVVVGHTPQATGEVLDLDHMLGIDTYIFGGGWLTAFNVETGQTWQADKEGCLRTE